VISALYRFIRSSFTDAVPINCEIVPRESFPAWAIYAALPFRKTASVRCKNEMKSTFLGSSHAACISEAIARDRRIVTRVNRCQTDVTS